MFNLCRYITNLCKYYTTISQSMQVYHQPMQKIAIFKQNITKIAKFGDFVLTAFAKNLWRSMTAFAKASASRCRIY